MEYIDKLKYLSKCLDLNDWEERFVEQMVKTYTTTDLNPTEGQEEKVNEIYEKVLRIEERYDLFFDD